MGLAQLDDPRWTRPRHLRRLEKELLRVERGECRRLIVMMPPRMGKSRLTTNYFPAWFLGRNPRAQVVIASHTADLAHDFSSMIRDTLTEFGPEVFGIHVSTGTASKALWRLASDTRGPGGVLRAIGVGGALFGRGADLLVIDDPYKDAADALSETMQEAAWTWYIGTLRNRLQPGGRVVLVMQRWHESDLAGRLIEHGEATGQPWEVVRFPAVAEEQELWPDGSVYREPGDVLWPEMYDRAAMEEMERDLAEWEGGYFWAAQFQQRPAPLGGGMFKDEWFQFFDVDEINGFYVLERNDGQILRYRIEDCSKFVTVDPAFSEKRAADWTVIQTWAQTPAPHNLLLIDQIREHIEGASIAERLGGVYRRERPSRIHVEAVGGGLVVAQQGRALGLPVVDLKVETDKRIRAMALQARMGAGYVYFRKGAPWFRVLRDEFLVFDNGRHDDQVDAGSMAAKVLAEQGTGRARSIKRALR